MEEGKLQAGCTMAVTWKKEEGMVNHTSPTPTPLCFCISMAKQSQIGMSNQSHCTQQSIIELSQQPITINLWYVTSRLARRLEARHHRHRCHRHLEWTKKPEAETSSNKNATRKWNQNGDHHPMEGKGNSILPCCCQYRNGDDNGWCNGTRQWGVEISKNFS